MFSSFLYLLYSQFSLYFLVLSIVYSRFAFILYYEAFCFFLILSFLPTPLYIFRFSISFIFSGFTKFSILSSFLYFLYFYAFHVLFFEFSQPLPIGFLSRKCFIYQFVLRNRQMFLIPVMLKDS